MNTENIMWHNLGDFEPIPGHGECGLVRVPRNIRENLSERGRFIGQGSVGIEACFVTDAQNIDIYISVLKPEFAESGTLQVFFGEFRQQIVNVIPGKVERIRISPPELFASVNEKMLKGKGYAQNVIRLVFDVSTFIFHGIDTHGHDIRKPMIDELPQIKWLVYGSSISNVGSGGYVEIAAKALNYQAQNMGFSGACHMEKSMVDYIIDHREFDVITCELGINMLGCFSAEVFEEKANYLLNRLIALGKPSFIITAYPSYHTKGYTILEDEAEKNDVEYRSILRRLVNEKKSDNLFLIEGEDILTDVKGLSADLVHPTAYGHALMGFNLANKMSWILEKI